ncbi:Na/Pi cotransporter family protein [Sporosarcina sp. UB5]|uniref:Na/Pi cotransporter family protein n=1 Tax=Sporosarcina sp. UB5 TaxID=3047463 RepID=UPI003D7A28EF
METFAIVLGGIGLFLLGMVLMTDGLKEVAGGSMRNVLSRFTGGLFPSICSGTVLTAIIQSSSATMLMTIGFVSAGVLSFTQSIGIVFGANLGSSSIGWIVSFIGLKVSVTAFALPLIGLGSLWRFLFSTRKGSYGMVIAGFGLIFLGIGTLQDGMAGLAESFSFGSLEDGLFWHQVLLILLGLVMTVVMQSSSTALVITLAALSASALTFDQAVLLVIGQNIGTTVKAYLVTIGGTVQAKRTALAHILYNVISGVFVFATLPLFSAVVSWLGNRLFSGDLTIMLALFSTLFYVAGILLILPFLKYFIAFIERLVPERGDVLTKYLDDSVASVPAVALESIRRTLVKVTRALAAVGEELYATKKLSGPMTTRLDEIELALNETRKFMSLMSNYAHGTSEKEYDLQVELIHTIDHLARLAKVFKEDSEEHFIYSSATRELYEEMKVILGEVGQFLTYEDESNRLKQVEENSLKIAELRRQNRKTIIEKTVRNQKDVDIAIQKVQVLHWVDRTAFHLWRAMLHLNNCVDNKEIKAEEWVDEPV